MAPQTEVLFFQTDSKTVPVRDWLRKLLRKDRRAYQKCLGALGLLSTFGHELRRPQTDVLRDGIHELRVRSGNVQARILYCFHGRDVVVLLHALTKKEVVPPADILRALQRRNELESDPRSHMLRIQSHEEEA